MNTGESNYNPQTQRNYIKRRGLEKDVWSSLGRGDGIDIEGGLGAGGNGNKKEQIGEGEVEEEGAGRDDWNRWALGGDVETQCSGNFLEPVRVTLAGTPGSRG